jgi:hypothetical protein
MENNGEFKKKNRMLVKSGQSEAMGQNSDNFEQENRVQILREILFIQM